MVSHSQNSLKVFQDFPKEVPYVSPNNSMNLSAKFPKCPQITHFFKISQNYSHKSLSMDSFILLKDSFPCDCCKGFPYIQGIPPRFCQGIPLRLPQDSIKVSNIPSRLSHTFPQRIPSVSTLNSPNFPLRHSSKIHSTESPKIPSRNSSNIPARFH